MRLTTFTIALASLLLAGTAGAAGGGEKTPGKGASAPAAATGDPGGGKSNDTADSKDRPTDTTFANKTWEVGLGLEYHHLINAGTYTNNASANNLNYYSATARWDPSPYDRIAVRYGFTESFLVDNGESGIRSDDISFSYTRRIPLPAQTTLRTSFSITAPVSYGSQLAGMITSPRLAIQADKRFGKYFSIDGRISGSLYFFKYAEGGWSYNGGSIAEGTANGLGSNGGGASPNTKGSLSLALSADFAMPFHEPLSVGVGLFTGYSWKYDVSNGQSCPPGTPSTICMYGTVMQSTKQPMGQRYGGEVSVRYQFPTAGGFKSDLMVAFAPLGDPTLGYTSVLRDGAQHIYGSYFSNAEVYGAVSARY